MVLLPRVGKITHEKVVAAHFQTAIVPSDCVIALMTANADEASLLRDTIITNWNEIIEAYSGTGAPHVTSSALLDVLSSVILPFARKVAQ
jgi:hypothetical protein